MDDGVRCPESSVSSPVRADLGFPENRRGGGHVSPWPSGEGGRGLSPWVGGRLQSQLRENRVNC